MRNTLLFSLRFVLIICVETMDDETPPPTFLDSPRLWSALTELPSPDTGEEPIGFAQPALRRAGWAAVPTLLQRLSSATKDANQSHIRETLARAVLQAAWLESDGGVQGAMWGGVLGVLRGAFLAFPLSICTTN